MTRVIDLTSRFVRCVYCHLIGKPKDMLYVGGRYFCSASCHNKHNKSKL